MFKLIFIFLICMLSACDTSKQELEHIQSELRTAQTERSNLTQEIKRLTKEKQNLQNGIEQTLKNNSDKCSPTVLHVLKLRFRQSHRLSLNPMKHLKDNMNASKLEIAVDPDYYKSVSVGQEISDDFRLGSAILNGSISSMTVTVIGKRLTNKL